MIRTYSNTLGEESSDFENVKADREIINLIISGFLEGTENVLTEERKSCLLFGGKALTLIQCIRFLTDYLNNDIYYKTTYKNQNWVRTQNQWHLYCSLKKIFNLYFCIMRNKILLLGSGELGKERVINVKTRSVCNRCR